MEIDVIQWGRVREGQRRDVEPIAVRAEATGGDRKWGHDPRSHGVEREA